MIRREITSYFKEAVRTHPVVIVFGPRQSGKTTLVRNVLPKHGYVNLENPRERRLATSADKRIVRRQSKSEMKGAARGR